MLSKEEKLMSRKRLMVRGHYFSGSATGFLVGTICGTFLFTGWGNWIYCGGAIALIYYLLIGFLEKRSFNEIKDVLLGVSE